MKHNYIFGDITEALPQLLDELAGAPVVGSRAGRTKELTHVGITIEEPWRREVLVPLRKCNIAAQIAETMWVLAGRNDIDWLANYLPRARDFSDDGKVWRGAYGARLRDWHGNMDQLAHVVETLKANPESRQAAAVLYDPVIDSYPGKDIPCNNWLSFLIRDGALDLHVAVRSNDAMWGWSGINVFEWSALQEIVAGLVGVTIGQLHFSVTSFHLYEKHWERAQRIVRECESTMRVEVKGSPRFVLPAVAQDLMSFDALVARWFDLEEKIRTNSENVWSQVDAFPEPMMRSWLRVIDWWWNGDETSLAPLEGTALEAACRMGLRPAWDMKIEEKDIKFDPQPMSLFLDHAIRVHNEKHAAYGDSWKRRGEMLGIMANIARKIDRLGGSETADETSADTALDLMVYLAKYEAWLVERGLTNLPPDEFPDTDETADYAANELLTDTENGCDIHLLTIPIGQLESTLKTNFDLLEKQVMSGDPDRYRRVDAMLEDAYLLARIRYDQRAPYEAVLEETFGDDYRGADHD